MSVTELVAARDGRLDAVLAGGVEELSRSRVASLIKSGKVQVDGHVVRKVSARVGAGQVLTVRIPPPTPISAQPQDLPLHIVWQDADLAVIDKAPGMVVHPGPGHPDGTLVHALLHHLGDLSGIGGALRPGIVHRLDRGTSGLLVVAKNDHAHKGLAEQFAAHTAGRRYLALVYGAVRASAGTVRSTLARHPKDRLRWASSSDPAVGRHAVTHWERAGVAGTLSLVGCRLETGRTHQVRVHLQELGHPIVGDPLYTRRGTRAPASIRDAVAALEARPLLHAWRLELEHPRTGEAMSWLAPPPADMADILRRLDLTSALPSELQAEQDG